MRDNLMSTKIRKYSSIIWFSVLLVTILPICISCEEEPEKDSLVVSRTEMIFESEGGEISFFIQTGAEEWRIQNPMDWVILSETNGAGDSGPITITVSSKTPEERNGVLKVIAGTADPIEITVSQKSSEFLYGLSLNYTKLNFKKGGNTFKINVTTDAPEWTINAEADWLHFSPASGTSGETEVSISADGNTTGEERAVSVSFAAEYTPTKAIQAIQIGKYYASFNVSPQPPNETGMTRTATELAKNMTMGINIGNTLEAIGGENAWGNPNISQTFVNALKNYGFNTVRLPCSYDQYANQVTGEISADWLNRVKEVVQYCINADLYVVLNIHWDGGWLDANINATNQEETIAKQKAFWEQIATKLRDFDERLMFAGSNEPPVENPSQMNILLSYHQTFIDAVRSTGGRNSYRVLVVQGPSTDIEKTYDLMNTLPKDKLSNKLMAEVHYYTPYQFTLMNEDASWGNMFYYWGADYHSTTDPSRNATWGEEADMERFFALTKSQFVNKGIPVILGEFGAYKRSNIPDQALHNSSVEYFNHYVVKTALKNGLIPYYWDTGGMINRSNGGVKDRGVLDALLSGGQ